MKFEYESIAYQSFSCRSIAHSDWKPWWVGWLFRCQYESVWRFVRIIVVVVIASPSKPELQLCGNSLSVALEPPRARMAFYHVISCQPKASCWACWASSNRRQLVKPKPITYVKGWIVSWARITPLLSYIHAFETCRKRLERYPLAQVLSTESSIYLTVFCSTTIDSPGLLSDVALCWCRLWCPSPRPSGFLDCPLFDGQTQAYLWPFDRLRWLCGRGWMPWPPYDRQETAPEAILLSFNTPGKLEEHDDGQNVWEMGWRWGIAPGC